MATGIRVGGGIDYIVTDSTSGNVTAPNPVRDYYVGDTDPLVDDTAPKQPAPITAQDYASVGKTHTGYFASTFGEDWYERIHTIPAQVLLGNVVANREVPVLVWNAFFIPKSITAVDEVLTDGIVARPPVDFELPYVVPPLGLIEFVLEVSTSGPSIINTTFDLTVDGIDYSLPVTGLRSVAFVFRPNWRMGSFDETWIANSWVFRSANGTEQSGSVSGADQARSLSFTITLTRKQAQKFTNMLFAWQERAFGVPHWGETTHLTADVAAGASIILCDTTKRSFAVGSSVLLFKDEDVWESRSILSVTPTQIELTTPLTLAWDTDSRVYPMLPGFIASEISTTWMTATTMRAAIRFDLEPSATPTNLPEVAAPLLYNGEELYLGAINWRDPLPMTFDSDAIRLNKKTGKIRTIPTTGFSQISREHQWFIRSPADADLMRKFVARRRGKARRVYMPGGTDDFTIVANQLTSDSTIDVLENQFGGLIGAHPARQHVFIRFNDGTYLAKRLVNATVLDGGLTTRLQFSEPHGRDINMADVKQITFLALYRFAEDTFTMKWKTDEKGEASATLTMVKENPL